jgi:CRP-like cAMP-binding protein
MDAAIEHNSGNITGASSSVLVDFIKNTNRISEETAIAIANNFESIHFNKNEFVLKSGNVCTNYIFLESGFMRSFAIDPNGNEVTTNFYSGKQIVIDVASYFQQIPSKENIQALTDCKCWYGKIEEFKVLYHMIPEFREFGRTILAKGYVELKERTLSIINQTAEERYLVLIKNNPEIFQNAPLKHIASYLGITDTSLSRIRKEIFNK